jgi:hypothetical protein
MWVKKSISRKKFPTMGKGFSFYYETHASKIQMHPA